MPETNHLSDGRTVQPETPAQQGSSLPVSEKMDHSSVNLPISDTGVARPDHWPDDTIPLYVSVELRLARVNVPTPPPLALWVLFRREDGFAELHPTTVFLLTPANHARLRHAAWTKDRDFAEGRYPREKLAIVAERWALVDRYARKIHDPADLAQAWYDLRQGKIAPLAPRPAFARPEII